MLEFYRHLRTGLAFVMMRSMQVSCHHHWHMDLGYDRYPSLAYGPSRAYGHRHHHMDSESCWGLQLGGPYSAAGP
jgi:hypothetical protein